MISRRLSLTDSTFRKKITIVTPQVMQNLNLTFHGLLNLAQGSNLAAIP